MKSSIIFVIFIQVLMVVLSSCGQSEKQEIQKLLSKREKAIETKNLDQYVECIHEQYNNAKDGKIIGPGDIRKNFENNSKIFDSIELTSSDINIYMKNNNSQAEVYQKTQYRLTIQQDQSRYTAVEQLNLENTKAGWKITKESDVDLFKAFTFGASN